MMNPTRYNSSDLSAVPNRREVSLRSPLLLALRLYFFWQLFLTGERQVFEHRKSLRVLRQPSLSIAQFERLLYRFA
jgi:uncharacterized membrane protein YphA (DoxX/SURF4 family)